MKKIAILASHNGSGFEAILYAIEQQILDATIPLVISNNSDAKALQKAKDANIPHYVVNAKQFADPDTKMFELLQECSVDFVFLSGYMKKLSPILTNNFTIINAHPSLLPKYGGAGMYGARVHEAVIANREKVSGVTLHYVNEHYDKGKIILQKSLQLSDGESVESLETKVKTLEKEVIVEGLQRCLS